MNILYLLANVNFKLCLMGQVHFKEYLFIFYDIIFEEISC